MAFSNWFSGKSDAGEFGRLLYPHVDHLYGLAFRFTSNRVDAEDLVQDLLIKLYGRRAELAKIEKLRPWLAQVLYRMFIDQVRQQQRRPIIDNSDTDCDDYQNHDPGPDSLLERSLTQDRLQQAFQGLNADQRALLAMHDIEGYTLSELETVLDTPIGTLKSRLHRARQRLREKL